MARNSLAVKGAAECKSSLEMVDSIKQDVLVLHRAAGKICTRIEGLQTLMDSLEAAGISAGVPHWRHGKYLSLVHPAKNGKRRSEYIGSGRKKVEEALARVARYETYRAHLAEVETCAHKWRAVRRLVAQCVFHISEGK